MDMIKVEKRDFTMKAKKLRRSGLIPGNVFGGPLPETVSLQIDEKTARKLITEKHVGSRLKLELDGKMIPVQLKETELNPLDHQILHISFQALKADQKVNSVAHVVLKNADMIVDTLEKMLMEIPYDALPADMVDTVTIDMDGMQVGTVVTVGDIPELNNEKIDLKVPTDEIVLRIENLKAAAPDEDEAETKDAE